MTRRAGSSPPFAVPGEATPRLGRRWRAGSPGFSAAGAWSSALAGSALSDPIRRQFEQEIAEGRILLLVDCEDEAFGAIEVCRFEKGWFSEVLPRIEGPFDVVVLDVDLAQSTRTCVKELWPRVCPGGTLFSLDGQLRATHEVLGDPRSEAPADPALEVPRCTRAIDLPRVPGLDVALQALELRLIGQVAQPVLEGVVHEALPEADLRVPLAPHVGRVAAGAVLHPLHRCAVLAEQDVAAGDVVGEAVDGLRAAQPARDRGCLEERQVRGGEAAFEEEARESESGDACAEDRDLQSCALPTSVDRGAVP